MATNTPEYNRNYGQALKQKVISFYGGKCSCCDEPRLVFLVIDHIFGGGNKEHSIVGHGSQFYRWLIRNNYPEGYQVLCHNCNFAKRMGICPHKQTGN